MKYREILPSENLRPFIDAYWILETDALHQPVSRIIYANGCTDIFVNKGNTIPDMNGIPFNTGVLYLGGTMTYSGVYNSVPNNLSIGIRFRPGGFSVFYNLPLFEAVDQVIEFPDSGLLNILNPDELLADRLNVFFSAKIKNSRTIIPIVQTVESFKGKISVDALAKTHHLTRRTLERSFNESIGITPKEFIKIMRFQEVLKKLRDRKHKESLYYMAYEMGYYDHAHLANEVKRYSGLTPSGLIEYFA